MRVAHVADLLGLPAAPIAATEDVLGVYIFHRHGDRTAKIQAPVRMTNLGAAQAFSSGAFYRDRYVSSKADMRIRDLSSDIAVHSQLSVTAPIDPVLENSAIAFLQGLYPPNPELEIEADGSTIISPLGGYQYVPVEAADTTTTTKKAESNTWLQQDSGCENAVVSSNQYFSSNEYKEMLNKTQDFYNRLVPVVNGTLSDDEVTFRNAYSIYDLVNVAQIHNSSMPSGDLLDEETVHQLFTLASMHEWNLAYNSTDTIRAIAGSTLGGQVVDALELIVEEPDANHPSLNIQFGTYGTFMSFFGLAGLPADDDDFYGIPEYASSMAFELLSNATIPTADDISVRFLFANGTATSGLGEFPLFGQKETILSWNDFKNGMMAFSVRDDEHWCEICGVTGGRCSKETDKDSDPDDKKDIKDDKLDQTMGGMFGAYSQTRSKIIIGLISGFGALALLILLFIAGMFVGGFKVTRKPVGWRQKLKGQHSRSPQFQPEPYDVEPQ